MSEYKFESGILTTPSGQATLTSERILPVLLEECCNEIEALTSALESANQRAEEAIMQAQHDTAVTIALAAELDLNEADDDSIDPVEWVAEQIKASLADKDKEIKALKIAMTDSPLDNDVLRLELESLRERLRENETALSTILRWCHGNIEIPCQVTPFCIQVRDLIEAVPTESPDTGEGS